ncbi:MULTISPECIES: glycosyltransferase family 2 protein [Acinetobacter]|uniref:glycosyltransferase family 2 protein n=1 Tax=Acinetobacter TaxID=469 RepID=UPI000DAC40E7|nr:MULTISPECIES: glycosyltransferase family 2 protein [Acinetobacter]AWV87483.1 glycosyltransferase family 2 protein [Acinetobacter radioresistens]MCK4079345.1 glycosyltransferase family 2 protein [Acinetobacter radioresistens]MCK4107660.1 glycosyltransferase family 2 protein [Acinetobacter radioresistens]MCX0327067.1 glycosyltransferase family 2 protein [Acinetobacter radioresistens]MCX0342018.1 glycosyltransferase family 2 protein [Acinetobacter radioresistens]
MKVSIVLPAKNEVGAIRQTIEKIRQLNIDNEIIVVNDGSTDKTSVVAEQAGAKVITHPYSKGNGAAIKTGARSATGEIIVFMDADGQHDPNDILHLLKKIEEGYDLVVGARQKGSQASMGRGIANGLYNNLASYMTEHKVEDLTSGFRAVRAEKFREFLYLLPNGFSYPTTSTMAFFRAGYSVTYVPIHAAKRIGKSHIQPMKDGVRFFIIIFKIATLFSPLKMFLPIAVVLFLIATGWYGYTLWDVGRFTNMSALLYTGSIMIFLMGLISEQITALMYKDNQ